MADLEKYSVNEKTRLQSEEDGILNSCLSVIKGITTDCQNKLIPMTARSI